MNVELKPVCECGHVFKEIKVAHLVLDGKEGLIAPIPKIIPSYCPECGKTIGSLSMNCIRQLGVISEDKLKELLDKERAKAIDEECLKRRHNSKKLEKENFKG